uniref:Uncharacterized protein n=1 Tax=Arundo donax TaxID=35708 RepID=A0A0A9A1A4_ARUDO
MQCFKEWKLSKWWKDLPFFAVIETDRL